MHAFQCHSICVAGGHGHAQISMELLARMIMSYCSVSGIGFEPHRVAQCTTSCTLLPRARFLTLQGVNRHADQATLFCIALSA